MKTDPILLGEQCANYIAARIKKGEESMKILCILAENGAIRDVAGYNLMTLMFERDFWRGKMLGVI